MCVIEYMYVCNVRVQVNTCVNEYSCVSDYLHLKTAIYKLCSLKIIKKYQWTLKVCVQQQSEKLSEH